MKISLIIPAYNEKKTLPKLITSLRKQTDKNFEIIIIDNNSTDNTFRVAKKLADKAYICKKKGSSNARNYGALKAKADIICFLDADCTVSKNWIEIVRKSFNENSNLSAISGLDTYDDHLSFAGKIINLYSKIVFYIIKFSCLIKIPYITANNFAIKRDLFLKVGGLDNYIVEDFYLSKKLRKEKKFIAENDYHMHAELSSRRIKKEGVVKMILLWFIAMFKKIPLQNYQKHDKL